MTKYFNTQGTQTFVNKLKFGNSALKTNAKTLVGAINELKIMIDNLPQPQIVHDYSNWQASNIAGSYSGTDYAYETASGVLITCSTSGIKYSEDGGKIWQDTNIINDANSRHIVQPSNSNIILAYGGGSILYSEDNGKTWITVDRTGGYIIDDIADSIVLLAHSNGTVYDSDVKYSEDGGKTWQNTNGVGDTFITVTFTDTNNNNKTNIIALSQAQNVTETIHYSEDGGKTWKNSNVSHRQLKSYITNIGGRVVISVKEGIKYSDDGGATWQDTNITSTCGSDIIKVNDTTLVVCIGNNIKYSEDRGETWQNSNVTSIEYTKITKFNSILLAYHANDTVCKVKYSEDNGKTWQDTNLYGETYSIFSTINTINNTPVLITKGCLTSNNISNGIRYSEDNGKTWQQSSITDDIKNIDISCVSDKVLPNNAVVICGNGGGAYSTDNCKTWQSLNLPDGIYDSMTITSDNTIVACSDYGLWYCVLPD